jgi:hypothetical protein
MANEQVHCKMCPLQEVCWGSQNPETQPAKDCPLARLVNGDVKIETSGYISVR